MEFWTLLLVIVLLEAFIMKAICLGLVIWCVMTVKERKAVVIEKDEWPRKEASTGVMRQWR